MDSAALDDELDKDTTKFLQEDKHLLFIVVLFSCAVIVSTLLCSLQPSRNLNIDYREYCANEVNSSLTNSYASVSHCIEIERTYSLNISDIYYSDNNIDWDLLRNYAKNKPNISYEEIYKHIVEKNNIMLE